ncbi:MAG: protease modulator HflC [bacterium]
MRKLSLIVLVLLALFVVGTSFFTVGTTEHAIVLRFGNPVRTIDEPGLKLKFFAPIDNVVRFDRRLQVFDIPTMDEPPRELLTLDKKNIEVSSYTCWRIADPLRFLETVTDQDGARAYLSDIVVSELGKQLGQHDLTALISINPDDLQLAAITESIREVCGASARQECGVEIVDFRIKRINLPEQNRESVFERMRAERKQIATRYRSEGEQRASVVRAEADRQRLEILAQARREALEIEGAGEAEAARIYNKAYAQDREFYEFLRTLESYEQTLTSKTTVLLPRDMEYLKTLADPQHGSGGSGR